MGSFFVFFCFLALQKQKGWGRNIGTECTWHLMTVCITGKSWRLWFNSVPSHLEIWMISALKLSLVTFVCSHFRSEELKCTPTVIVMSLPQYVLLAHCVSRDALGHWNKIRQCSFKPALTHFVWPLGGSETSKTHTLSPHKVVVANSQSDIGLI